MADEGEDGNRLIRLPNEPGGGPGTWSRRYKANVERLKGQQPEEIAAVVDELSARYRDKGLSSGEKRMLERARRLLGTPPGDGAA